MDTWQGNKLTSQIAMDRISMDSLSFSGLVSIQDQQPKLSSPIHYQVSKQDPEFEFTNTKANLNTSVNPIKITPADKLISNGKLQPQALAFQTNPHSSSRSLLASNVSNEKSSGKTGTMKYHELGIASKHTKKQSTAARAGFGQKMKSFLSPCRECRTIKPGAVKAQTVQGENFKIY